MKMFYTFLPNYVWNSGIDMNANVLWSYSCRTLESEGEDNEITGVEIYCHNV